MTMVGHKLRISLEAVGVAVLWDAQRMISIEATAGLWNRTAGLCGTLDQDISNEFKSKDGTLLKMASTFVDAWKTPALDEDVDKCVMDDKANADESAMELQCSDKMQTDAQSICTKLIENPKFGNCLKEYSKDALLKNCISDYCYCSDSTNPTKCACEGLSVFAKDCQFRGVILDNGWRDMELCRKIIEN